MESKAMAKAHRLVVVASTAMGVVPIGNVIAQKTLGDVQDRDLLVDEASSAFLANAISNLSTTSALLASIAAVELVGVTCEVAYRHLARRALDVGQRLLCLILVVLGALEGRR